MDDYRGINNVVCLRYQTLAGGHGSMYMFERIANAVLPYRDNLIVCMETAADFMSLDLLEHKKDVDTQTLLESLSNYYFEYQESFATLEEQLNEAQRQSFSKWRQDAVEYYTED